MFVLENDPREGIAQTVLVAETGQPWALVRLRWWDRARAHLRSLELDAELAAGAPIDTERVRAMRAAVLIMPRTRRTLARGWRGVVSDTRSQVPVQRSRVLASVTDIDELIQTLSGSRPLAPPGVARASLLLTDGRGPLFNPLNTSDLRAEIRLAVSQMTSGPAGDL